MHYQRKVVYHIILLVLLVLSINFEVNAAETSKKDTPIYLKLGRYYILYTYPDSPFIENNRLMVSVKSVQDLMGGEVKYDNTSKEVTINWLKHEFKLKPNSYDGTVDGKSTKLDTKPVIKQNMLFIPVYILLNNSDIQWRWNSNYHLLEFTDSRAINGIPFNDFESNEIGADILNENAFHLISYSVKPGKPWATLSIQARNISKHDIPNGKADIHPLVSYLNKGGYSADSYVRRIDPFLPIVKKDGTVLKTRKIEFENVAYIICVGRELK